MHILQALPRHLASSAKAHVESDLPACIEQVARHLGALYNPAGHQARTNLNADAFSVRSYLGTYLPRTVFEFMTIGTDILDHEPMRKVLRADRPLRVLDLGSGTGGAWLGMAIALSEHGFAQGLEVVAVDGNPFALAAQPAFAEALATDSGVAIQLTTIHRRLGLSAEAFGQDLCKVLAELGGVYDFVLVSKHLSEFYCASGREAHGVVYQALELLGQVLAHSGFMVLLDMTTRIDEVGEFFPSLMARELGAYLGNNPAGMHPVLPVPCAVSAVNGCAGDSGNCYTQREMHFRHGMTSDVRLRSENTKVTYRVMAQAAQAQHIAAGYSCNLAYHVNARRDNQACHSGRIVHHMRGFNGYLTSLHRVI